jgi:uncharacterized membrane protein
MHVILGLVIGILGVLRFGVGGAVLGGLIGVLGAEVWSLRKRLDLLEKAKAGKNEETLSQEIVFEPATPEPPPGKQSEPHGDTAPPKQAISEKLAGRKSQFDRFLGGLGDDGINLVAKIGHFFTSGNLVLKIGIIILFIGVAFLVKYAAARDLIPIELRLAGVALSGMAILGIGWWLRHSRSGYGLTLQGGGVGILYLVVFGAAKIYGFLPMTLSLAVMIGLVALSCTLAVLQESKSLAVFGIIGGFLAPVLMSTGDGSHVMLFSYYGLLNAGILGIAWFKSWRELNLIGFFFTFGIGTFWGSTGYRPEYFQSTEPFLILFFVFYVLISILFAHRQPINLRGYIDGPLVFGLPLVVSGLQYFLVKDFQYGMAFSALALGLFYLTVATLLWRKLVEGMRLLTEAFLALGVVFGSLAIPLALDGHWSASIWALEGAGLIWVGVRQQRVLARHFGLLLQLAAAYIFLNTVLYPFSALLFLNRYFLGCTFLSVAALFSSYYLDTHSNDLKKWEHRFPLPLMILGLGWWYIGGLQEMDYQMPHREALNGFLLFCSASSILMGIASKKLHWSRLGLSLLLQLPAMIILLSVSFLGFRSNFHLLGGWGAVAWIIGFIIQYRIIYLFGGDWPNLYRVAWHLGTMWLLLFVLSHEAGWAVEQLTGVARVWSMICWAIIPCGAFLLLLRLGRGEFWPVGRYKSSYLGAGGVLPAFGLVLWMIFSFSVAGDPSPLPYIPLLNPVELVGIVAIAILVLWVLNRRNNGYTLKYLPARQSLLALSVLFFFWVNSVVARSVHFFAGVPYYPDSLYRSVVFQAAIAALWGLGALAITIWAARKGSRPIWGVGAALLGMVVLKLFLVDLSGTGTIARIVSFLVVGILMLIIGYFSPLPPKREEGSK